MVAVYTTRVMDSKDHLTRTSNLITGLIMGSSSWVKIFLVSKETHKDNLIKDNLGSLVVRNSLILGNLQEIRDNRTSNKVDQVPNKATLRGSPTGTRDNLTGDKVNP
jgi:hypothetical protein